MDSLFGKKKTRALPPQIDPTIDALNRLKLAYATNPSAALEPYIRDIVVPSTVNTATAMGQGRSGAATEAVAHATTGAGVDLIKGMLGYVPSGLLPGGTVESRQPGILDFAPLLTMFGGLLGSGGPWGQGGAFGGSSRDWLSRVGSQYGAG